MMIFVRPTRPGLVIRNPDVGFERLPDEGTEVIDGAYWRQHERQGSVTIEPRGPSNVPSPPPSKMMRF